MPDFEKVHREAIVIDPVCPLLFQKKYLELYKSGGATAVGPTVGGWLPAETTLRALGSWLEVIRERDDLLLVRSAADIERAKNNGKLGVIFHFQGTEPIEDDVALVDAYKEIGVGIIQLCYNTKNRVGDGCEERTDAGLSHFGLRLIRRMNEARVIIDCSHTGHRSSMEAIDASAMPVIISHANSRAIHDASRNIGDDQIRAISRTGGVIGIAGFPSLVSHSKQATLDEYINHIDHVADLVGIDHVAIALDFFEFQDPFVDDVEAERRYHEFVDAGLWSKSNYPPPPYFYPKGIETPQDYPNLTRRLLERGFRPDDVKKVLGENWMRVYRSVWGN
jgi:membrane dipeptidase